MNTITIPDPADVKAAVIAAGLDSRPLVWFTSDRLWCVNIWPKATDYQQVKSEKATPEECIADLRRQMAEYDPAAKLKADAAKLGLKVVPIDAPELEPIPA